MSLLHNDYKYDNMVLDAEDLTRIVGLLDWEMCTVGDSLADPGNGACVLDQRDGPGGGAGAELGAYRGAGESFAPAGGGAVCLADRARCCGYGRFILRLRGSSWR